MLAPWAIDEMKQADLKDERLNRRLVKLLSAFGERPQVSIPAACGGWNETSAAYRFFDNEKVTPSQILKPHFNKTIQRIAEHPVVLLTQDTTELDFTRPQQQVIGAGPLDGSSRRGVFLHPLVAFTPEGVPLGSVAAELWAREEEKEDEAEKLSPQQKKYRKATTPIEDKESYRWLQGLREACEVAQQVPNTQCVCVADSEADIYELFAEPRGEVPVHWLVRACQNRSIVPQHNSAATVTNSSGDAVDTESASDTVRHVREQVELVPVLFTKKISVRGREPKVVCSQRSRSQPRVSREATVEVRVTTVTLLPPRRRDRRLPPVSVNVVWVREVNPPENDEPVDWLLFTTLPIDTVEQVALILQCYASRFLIEVFFRVLKSGCRVEERQFEHVDRLQCCVALYMIVAWRVLMLCRLGQSCPDLDCETIFEPAEWKAVWSVTQRQKPPTTAPRLGEMIRLVAQLGGYVNRPNRKEPPGPQTVWLGMQRTRDLAWAWTVFGPEASSATAPIADDGLV
jgi:hypothetical protein